MKGLLKYLSPFAPDQSGAASVLYDLGGITVICDAGGCTGNICGFDEPRWFEHKSAIFSAGLRDMDAILGRDDRLIAKLKDTAQKVDAAFAAIIGTPVPAVIATDYHALERMGEKRCGIPILTVECTGSRLYDEGEEETYLKLFQKFVDREAVVQERTIGVIGMTPLDISLSAGDMRLREALKKDGWDTVFCYGMGDDLNAVRQAGCAQKNLVVSPAGLKVAKFLEKTFGTPYEICYPFLSEAFRQQLRSLEGKKILIVHQQAAANEIRGELRAGKCADAEIVAGTWFMKKKELAEPQDIQFTTEDGFAEAVSGGDYDVIIGDALLRRPLKGFQGQYIELAHFAVSGNLYEE